MAKKRISALLAYMGYSDATICIKDKARGRRCESSVSVRTGPFFYCSVRVKAFEGTENEWKKYRKA